MNGSEYVQKCKERTKAKSYYELANLLDISETDLNYFKRGERLPSVYACFKFAECLSISPSIIIADIASETEKNSRKRDYFKSFMLACRKVGTNKLLTIAFNFGVLGVISSAGEALRIMSDYGNCLMGKGTKSAYDR